jgi:hypothetical protein
MLFKIATGTEYKSVLRGMGLCKTVIKERLEEIESH